MIRTTNKITFNTAQDIGQKDYLFVEVDGQRVAMLSIELTSPQSLNFDISEADAEVDPRKKILLFNHGQREIVCESTDWPVVSVDLNWSKEEPNV